MRFLYGLIFLLSIGISPLSHAENYVRSLPIICSKDSISHPQFDRRFSQYMETWQIPGAAVTIMKNNKILLSCGYGWADVEGRQPVQPDSLFRIGSISKTITALTILQLAQQKKLQLDDKVFAKPITIKNLLQMSSGWYTDRPQDYDPLMGPWSSEMLKQLNYQTPPTCEAAVRMMMDTPLQFIPGQKYSYSNLNYCMLGLIINKIIQQAGSAGYEIYIKRNLLAPIGIYDMQLGESQFENKANNEVKYYYSPDNNVFKDIDRILDGLPYSQTDILKKNYADGGWIASAPDLAKLLQALSNNKILSKEMLAIMLAKPSYAKDSTKYPAMGWDEVGYQNGQRYFLKTGRFTGTQALIIQRSDGTSYTVLFNYKPSDMELSLKQLREILINFSISDTIS